MKWLDECPTSRQAGKAGSQARRQPGRRQSGRRRWRQLPSCFCVDRPGACTYCGGVADTGQQQIKQQSLMPENNESATAAAAVAAACIWLISENEEKSCRNAKTKWAAASAETEIAQWQPSWCVCVCVSQWYVLVCWVKSTYLSFISHSFMGSMCMLQNSIWLAVWNLKMNMLQAIHVCMFLYVCVCMCVFVWTAEFEDKAKNQQWKSYCMLYGFHIFA